MHGRAQHRVAEIAGRQRLEVAIALLAYRVGRLIKDEELVFEGGRHREPHLLRLPQHAAQEAARADRLRLAGELAQEEGDAVLEGQDAARVGQEAHGRVRIGRVPARIGDVVVELVVGVPADDDVAEAEALLQGGQEFLTRQVFAAQDPVDVGEPDLHVGVAALLDEAPRLLCILDADDRLLCRHQRPLP
jgi:hypothetical protein